MKRLFTCMALVAGLLAGVVSTSAFAAGKVQSVGEVTSTYVKKDKAYWTRVWYRKNGYVRSGGKWVKKRGAKVRRASAKRSKGAVNRRVPAGRVTARVDLSQQTMNVYKGGKRLYTWPVSTGRAGYRTPTGTWKVHRMHKEYYSKKYDGAPMPYAMFYYRGFAIHGTNAISRLGRTASHGCVRLHPSNAATLFSMIRRSGGTVKVVQ
ncbi:MAG: L,D-transpeptidase [Pseudomonadota bacterium]